MIRSHRALSLWNCFQFAELDALAAELYNGFEVTGELVPGPGWLPRTDDKYRYPISAEGLKAHLFPHSEQTTQLQGRRALGADVSGAPTRTPSWQNGGSGLVALLIEIDGYETQSLEHSDIRCAFSFAVAADTMLRSAPLTHHIIMECKPTWRYPRPSTRSDSRVKYGVRTYPQHADSLLWMNLQTASQYYAALVDRCC